ncbi:MAG: IclR family transcriptional regulator [Chloroflexota bacterium]
MIEGEASGVRRATSPMARWLRVLDAFGDRDEWGIRDLATHAGMPRSAVHRIVHGMAELGMLAPAATDGRYRVGPATTRLAVVLAERVDVRSVARPVMEVAARELDETLVLALHAPDRGRFWAVDAVESSHPIRYIWAPLRQWSELHTGASGKGILAFLPPEDREAVLRALPDPVPGHPPISLAALRAELDRARARGHVVSHGERFPGAVGVSAPIRDATGRVIGDLVFGWPDNRTSAAKERRAVDIVVRAADDVSTALGHRPDTGR